MCPNPLYRYATSGGIFPFVCLFCVGFGITSAVATSALGGGVVCPVCGQVVEESESVCPNDGTDLRLLGKPVENSNADKNAQEGQDTRNADNGNSGAAPPLENGGYKRHDETGDRRVSGEKASEGYSDRRSRLPADSRTGAVAVKRHKQRIRPPEPQPEPADDSTFFSEYEKKRRYLWDARKAAVLLHKLTAKERKLARERLLSSLAAPITSLGGRMFFMGEKKHPGPVSGAEIDLHLARYRLRAGFSTFLGIRALEARNELVFLESLSVGGQIPGRFSPYLIAKGGIGMIAAERFETDRAYLLTSVGAESGVDAWINPWLSITPTFGYMRCTESQAYWHTFTFKLAVGF